MPNWKTPMEKIEIGTGRILHEGSELAILTLGHIGNYATEVVERLKKEGINIGHYDLRFAKPLDGNLLHKIFKNYAKIITVEDGCIAGGFGSALLEFMNDNGYHAMVMRLGIPDEIIEHGTQLELHRECGFDPGGIYDSALTLLEASTI
jgi:1-deoxy-D-xylulose-5-phosphate synthase